MKKILLIVSILSAVSLSSCEKDEFSTANATLSIPGPSTLCFCCSSIHYQIDGATNSEGTNTFRANQLPPGMDEPASYPFSARVHIKYKADDKTTCTGNYIIVTEMQIIK